MRVALYARISTNDKQDVELQLVPLREYALARGWAVQGEFIDRGVSGAKERRPALDLLMDDARRRSFDIVFVWRFDRFARSTRHLVNALHEFRHLGINFCSYSENIDTSSPMGEAMFSVIGAVAQLERDIIRERVKAGVAQARRRGKQLGRPKKVFRRDEVERLRAEGLSFREIGRKLGVSASLALMVYRNGDTDLEEVQSEQAAS